ncbi:MAG: hypothetical protein R6W89_00605 [Candidatus Hydrogenedentota bacterium]
MKHAISMSKRPAFAESNNEDPPQEIEYILWPFSFLLKGKEPEVE